MLQFLDYFLTGFHAAFVLFILFGWIPEASRKAHLIALALTIAAWLLLGIWYGIGYCPLTDWHWDIKKELGEKHLPNSFTKYVFDQTTGLNSDKRIVDIFTAGGLVFGIVMAGVKFSEKRRIERLKQKREG
jgi:hypothetical protein